MNERMNHRYEAIEHPDGSWTVGEFTGSAPIAIAPGFTKREALQEAVRLNRDVLREQRLLRGEKSALTTRGGQ